MRSGMTAAEALRGLVAADTGEARRQVGMVDDFGGAAVHTGGLCVREAGHVTGEQFTVQANMMLRATVPQAMATAFTSASGDLASRLLAALDAAEIEGGDVRGRQSAAILVVEGARVGAPWRGRVLDLRAEDHLDPLAELRRLVTLKQATIRAERGLELAFTGEFDRALAELDSAILQSFRDADMVFRRGVLLAVAGRIEEARDAIAEACRENAGWAEFLRRLPPAGLFRTTPGSSTDCPSGGERPAPDRRL